MNKWAIMLLAVFFAACVARQASSPSTSKLCSTPVDPLDVSAFDFTPTHITPNDGRETYGDKRRESSVFDEVRCAVTLGEITRYEIDHIYARIEWMSPADPATFSHLEKEAGRVLSKAGHQPSTATLTLDELAVDVSALDYFKGAPVSDYERRYLSRRLQALREPDLLDAPEGSYRFLWVRAFDEPVTIRVVGPPETATLIAKVGASSQRQQAKLCLRVEKKLTAQQYDSLCDTCSNQDVWQWSEEDLPHRKDGARWVLEARQGGRHLSGRARSPESGALRDCALRLLDIAGIPKGEVY